MAASPRGHPIAHPFDGVVAFQEASEEAFRQRLVRVSDDLRRRIMEYAAAYDRERDGRFNQSARNLARLESMREQVDDFLIASGYPREVASFTKGYGDLRGHVEEAWTELGLDPGFRSIDLQALRYVTNAHLDRFANIGTAGVEIVKSGIMEAITSGEPIESFRTRLETYLLGQPDLKDKAGHGMFRHAGTLATTSISELNRTMNGMLAQNAGVERFQYIGGIIQTTRLFCRDLDGRILTREEIDALDNGQTANGSVFVAGGGFNCRHLWSPVLDDAPMSVKLADEYAARADQERERLGAEEAAGATTVAVPVALTGDTGELPDLPDIAEPLFTEGLVSEADADIGEVLAQRINANYEAAVAEYDALEGTHGGRVLDVDLARELSPDYRADRSRSAEVHEASSGFIKRLYAERLAELPEGSTVEFLGGGTAAGKSTATAMLPADAALIYDGTLAGFTSSKGRIEQALAAGADVRVTYVYREPELAADSYAARTMRMGRAVPIDTIVRTHLESNETVRRLAAEYEGDPRVSIGIINNSFSLEEGGARAISIGELPPLSMEDFDETKANVVAALERAVEEGRLSQALFDATVQGVDPGSSGRVEPRAAPEGGDGGGPRALEEAVARAADAESVAAAAEARALDAEAAAEAARAEAERVSREAGEAMAARLKATRERAHAVRPGSAIGEELFVLQARIEGQLDSAPGEAFDTREMAAKLSAAEQALVQAEQFIEAETASAALRAQWISDALLGDELVRRVDLLPGLSDDQLRERDELVTEFQAAQRALRRTVEAADLEREVGASQHSELLALRARIEAFIAATAGDVERARAENAAQGPRLLELHRRWVAFEEATTYQLSPELLARYEIAGAGEYKIAIRNSEQWRAIIGATMKGERAALSPDQLEELELNLGAAEALIQVMTEGMATLKARLGESFQVQVDRARQLIERSRATKQSLETLAESLPLRVRRLQPELHGALTVHGLTLDSRVEDLEGYGTTPSEDPESLERDISGLDRLAKRAEEDLALADSAIAEAAVTVSQTMAEGDAFEALASRSDIDRRFTELEELEISGASLAEAREFGEVSRIRDALVGLDLDREREQAVLALPTGRDRIVIAGEVIAQADGMLAELAQLQALNEELETRFAQLEEHVEKVQEVRARMAVVLDQDEQDFMDEIREAREALRQVDLAELRRAMLEQRRHEESSADAIAVGEGLDVAEPENVARILSEVSLEEAEQKLFPVSDPTVAEQRRRVIEALQTTGDASEMRIAVEAMQKLRLADRLARDGEAYDYLNQMEDVARDMRALRSRDLDRAIAEPARSGQVTAANVREVYAEVLSTAKARAEESQSLAPPRFADSEDMRKIEEFNGLVTDLVERGELSQEMVDVINERVETIVANSQLTIRTANLESLASILRDGRFKTQFETGSSGGSFGLTGRAEAEESMFDTSTMEQFRNRPVYGYLRDPVSESDSARQYGGVAIILKDDVRPRATLTGGDSLALDYVPSSMNQPSIATFMRRGDLDDADQVLGDLVNGGIESFRSIDNLRSFGGNPYVEFQVHGGLSTLDIKEIRLDTATLREFEGPFELFIRAWADENDIPIILPGGERLPKLSEDDTPLPRATPRR